MHTLKLILDPSGDHHVSLDAISEFEAAVRLDRRVEIVQARRAIAKALAYTLWFGGPLRPRFRGASATAKARDFFVALMTVDNLRCLPYFLLPARKSVYLMDAWPSMHADISHFVRMFSIEHLFLSSSIAVGQLKEHLPGCTVTWIPEAVDPSAYRYLPENERDIDVLQMGRRHDALHKVILPQLLQREKKYLFEKTRGEIVFPTRREFIEGLGRTKVSLCYPASVTHPEMSGPIEVLSMRYLQSMASKCVVVGHSPTELTTLFGYNPVVELDDTDPAGQLMAILDTLDSYAPLVERNYETVLNHHTWHHRWEAIAALLFPSHPPGFLQQPQ
jgi:hypothetical protein